ncbi:hypothetical protein V6Z90_001116 [Aspergillus fumigatus]
MLTRKAIMLAATQVIYASIYPISRSKGALTPSRTPHVLRPYSSAKMDMACFRHVGWHYLSDIYCIWNVVGSRPLCGGSLVETTEPYCPSCGSRNVLSPRLLGNYPMPCSPQQAGAFENTLG